MNWEALGAIGDLVGGLAVVVTLGYLALQVRSANVATADANRLARAAGVRELLKAVATDDGLRESINAMDAPSLAFHERYAEAFGVRIDQAQRAEYYCEYFFWLHWGQFASSNEERDLAELRNIANSFYRIPYVRYSWDHSPYVKSLLDPSFVRFIDGVLENEAPES